MIRRAMVASGKADDTHASRFACNDAIDAVFDNDALVRECVHRRGCMEKEIRGWLSICDQIS